KFCHICKLPFNIEALGVKVRDHDHLNGKYRGPAHQKCNLNYSYLNGARTKCIVPVGFHNLKGYDSHLIMKANLNGWFIKVLSTSGEKFLSFDLIYGNVCYRFIDTMQFLASSLEEIGRASCREREEMKVHAAAVKDK